MSAFWIAVLCFVCFMAGFVVAGFLLVDRLMPQSPLPEGKEGKVAW